MRIFYLRWLRQPKILGTGLASCVLVALTGCSVLMRDTPTPIPTQAAMLSGTGRSSTLVVLLPGRGDSPGVFQREGFVTVLREAGVAVDVIAVDAHLGYYYKRTVIERLRTDVLVPARQQGYRRIVLVGVSLGGIGALLSEREHPDSVDALVLLGPYLGDDNRLFDKIASEGGPMAWAAGRDGRAGSVEEQLWTFLGTKTATLPTPWLLYGRHDPYRRGQRLFADFLPKAHVMTSEGAHDWPTWRELWRELCFHSDLFQVERSHGALVVPDTAATVP